MKRREWLRIVLGGIATLLFVGCLIVGFAWIKMATRLSGISESIAFVRKDGAVILPLVEGELYGLPKEEVLQLLYETLIKYPEYNIRQVTESCIEYERVFFLFKEGRFLSFDKHGSPECHKLGHAGKYRLFYSGR